MKWATIQVKQSSTWIIFVFHLTWGCILWWSVAAHGLGTSRDSVEYLFTSLNLSKGNGFLSFQGHPYVLWPPLYPTLLSLVQMVGATDPMEAALVLQLLTFGWLAGLFSWLFSRMFPQNLATAFLGNALAGTGVALTMLFQSVGSDYLFIALSLSMMCLCHSYISDNRIQTLALMILVSALAMLQRYIGITVLFTCALIIFYYTRSTVQAKLKRLILMGLSVVPLALWAVSLPAEALLRGEVSSLQENFYRFNLSILSLFLLYSQLDGHPVRLQFGMGGFWFGIAASSWFFWKFRKRLPASAAVGIPAILFGGIYATVLLILASSSSFNYLDSRFVAPVWIPFVILALATSEIVPSVLFIKRYAQKAIRMGVYLLLVVILGLSGYQSAISISFHRETGWGYTSSDWNDNSVIGYLKSHRLHKGSLVFSNYPAGVAVQVWQVTLSAPRRTSHPNAGEAIIPLDTYLPVLFDPDKESYLVWIEPNEFTHVYTVDNLRQFLIVETVYESADGGIYRILPPK